ncbi:MAG TPA: DUF2092 domain-containing protein [Stellaceae bacterium]|nr:DUF2092 domain-containing protein [Stellaceae bacterium]
MTLERPSRPMRRLLTLAAALLLAAGLGSAPALSADTSQQAPKKTSKSAKQKPPAPAQLVLEQRAIDLLKAVSNRLAAAKAMTFTAVVSYEHPSQLGPPLLYTMRYDVTMQRPDKLKVIIPGDGPASEFYYDGKTMMAFAPAANLVAIADAPPTLDAALKAAYDTAAIYFPFTDLIAADPYAALADGAILAFYIGPSGVIGGTKTDMVAWANKDVFLQIWIGADDKLPRRIRAMYKDDPLGLRHDMELSNWQIDPEIAPDAFGSQKAQSAPRIAFAHPFDSAPPGAKPLGAGKSSKSGSSKPGANSAPKP